MNLSKPKGRELALLQLGDHAGGQSRISCAQNFSVQWCEGSATEFVKIEDEAFAFFADGGCLTGEYGVVRIPAKTLAILPPGSHRVDVTSRARVLVFATGRKDIHSHAIIGEGGDAFDARIAPIGEPFTRKRGLGEIHLYELDKVTPPPGNERLKIFQTATMSVNYVEYIGARDRKALSPHSHPNFEQCTLVVEGDFVHHLREEWGKDADAWREDMHLQAGDATMLYIPPMTIHTSEGVGSGVHILFDIFSPPRRDFIAKGWVVNSDDYSDPLAK